MKNLILLIVLYFFLSPVYTNAHYSGNQFSVNYFYGELAPYGEWIEINHDYLVWRPASVHYNWSPYTLGRWSWTHYGWYWESYEPFGWATYHYGRWYYEDYYGWVWVPDNEWGPSWVEWRYSDYYVGWAPLPPYAVYRPGIGIHFTISWHTGYHHWNFVNIRNFHYDGVNNYLISDNYRSRIFNRTKYRTNYYEDRGRIVNGGIDRSYVESRGGYKLKEREVILQNESKTVRDMKSGSRDRIIDYRPSNSQILDENKREMKNSYQIRTNFNLKF